MGETAMTVGLVWLAVVCGAGAVIGHCSRALPPPRPTVHLVRARRDLWIVDHRPMADELAEIRR